MNIIKKGKINYPKMYYKNNELLNTAVIFSFFRIKELLICDVSLHHSVTA